MKKVLVLIMLAFSILCWNSFASANLQPVKSATVCMVNNQYMMVDQIPVIIKGKTYYGCCNNCKYKLTHNKQLRFATDPHTGSVVNKAKAYIVKDLNNKVYYFANKQSFKSHQKIP